ncbi:MAG: tRNA (adenosine(37)-N6)-threonylcarbamoyltransferase complex dimerization subunit type 1 TsaB [Cyclobacteriaceae bacterium]|nr:tRNA (adenosine(37)-N6)-threonylcarbamoyltransferase complex dimerization subunit type 1 TsaB [Cyclobacteriaceae bacterium]
MPLILSIETSTSTSSIALHDAGRLISSQHIHVDKSHAEYLALSIKYLFETSGYAIRDCQAVAISKGPGSYTGLRIGTSTAKGICYAIGAKLISINTLKAMALGVSQYQFEEVLLCPMIDARRMEVYCMVTKADLDEIEPTTAKIIDDHAFDHLLTQHKMLFFGNGSAKCVSKLSQYSNAVFIPNVLPSAVHVGDLAWRAFQDGIFEDIAYFEPFYLKDFIAKKPSVNRLV